MWFGHFRSFWSNCPSALQNKSICQKDGQSASLPLYAIDCRSRYLSICLSIYLPVCLSTWMSSYLPRQWIIDHWPSSSSSSSSYPSSIIHHPSSYRYGITIICHGFLTIWFGHNHGITPKWLQCAKNHNSGAAWHQDWGVYYRRLLPRTKHHPDD